MSQFIGLKSQFIEMFRDAPKAKLQDVCHSGGEYGSNTPATCYDGKVRYVRITDITDEGTLNSEVVSPSVIDKRYMLHNGDFLFARTGNTVGKTYVHQTGTMLFAGYLIRYKLNPSKMLPMFLHAYTHTTPYYSWVEQTKKVGAQPNISATQYSNMEVPTPSIDKQKEFLVISQQADKSGYYN